MNIASSDGPSAWRGAWVLACIAMLGACKGAIGDQSPGSSTNPLCAPEAVGMQRLNRREYTNTLRDVLGLETVRADLLPIDPLKGGFDTNASALETTPELYEAYVSTAEGALEDAFASHYDTLVACTPATASSADPCVLETLERLARRAYRHPLSDDDRVDLASLFDDTIAETDDTREAFLRSFLAVLASPAVIYRGGAASADEDGRLDDFALATRLAYFLWSAPPDDQLLARAEEGGLRDEDILASEVDRMLLDERALAFVDAFTSQWLDLGRLPTQRFTESVFPSFDEAILLPQMIAETNDLVARVFRADLDPRAMLLEHATLVGPELASHYGLVSPSPDETGRVVLPAERGGGILTSGAILASTAHPDRTSIPSRGMFVMANVLCVPTPPPPPEGVDTSVITARTDLSQRERLEVHRTNPTCAGCHSVMDEIGFGLERFDAVGVYREIDSDQPIDARGSLPDGRTFDGATELAALLASPTDPTFPRCFAKSLLAYAVGRLVTEADDCTLDSIASSPAVTAQQIVVLLVASDAFQKEKPQ